MLDDTVAVLRHFNRTFTPRIGVLDESFLGTGLPFAAARLLFEIGLAPVTVHELRRRLGADSGYVSRLLRRLEDDDLIRVADDPTDGRRRIAALTDAGRLAWNDLDGRSDEIARRLVDRLTADQHDQLRDALTRADRLLRLAAVTLNEVAPGGAEAMTAMRAYVVELDQRFPERFDIGTGFDDDEIAQMTGPSGTFIVVADRHASDDGTSVLGCGGLRRLDDTTAEIKRMWVHPSIRGLGLGRQLLDRLEIAARQLGYQSVALDTHATLDSAIAMYETAGYLRVDRYNDNPYAHLFFRRELS